MKTQRLEITLRLRIDAEDAEEGVLTVARAAYDAGARGVHRDDGLEVAWTRLREDGTPEVSQDEDIDQLALALSRLAPSQGEDTECDD